MEVAEPEITCSGRSTLEGVAGSGPGGQPNAAALQRKPGPASRYAVRPSPASGRFGHGAAKSLHRLLVAPAWESGETRCDQSNLLDRRLGVLLEVALQPPGRHPRVPTRILPGDQHR